MSTNNEELLEVINEIANKLDIVKKSMDKKMDEIIAMLKDIQDSQKGR